MAGTPRFERFGLEGGGMREEELFARCCELGAGKEGGGMSDDGAGEGFKAGFGGGGMARC